MPEIIDTNNPEVSTTSPSASNKPKSSKTILISVIIVLIILLTGSWFIYNNGWFDKILKNNPENTSNNPNDQPAAHINGVDIMVKDVQTQANALIAGSGITDITPELQQEALQQALQILINQEILYQTAVNAGIIADQTQIDTAIKEIKNRFTSEEEYNQALAKDGLTEVILRDSLNRQIIMENYVESVINTDSITSTEEEVQNLYNQYAAIQDGMPEIDIIYSQLEDELKKRKINEQLNVIIEQLLNEADFQIL